MKYYAGIGSRSTPPDVLAIMKSIAHDLEPKGWWLRSGHAVGADLAFERGAGDRKQIFTADDHIPEEAFEIAKEIHPNWQACKPYARRLLARNVLQITGQNLDMPVKFVICWTPDGCERHEERSQKTGGTGQAISLASLLNIPVFNLYHEGRIQQVIDYTDEGR